MLNAQAPAAPAWRIDPPYGTRTAFVVLLVAAVLWFTGARVEMHRMLALTGEAVLAAVGLKEQSQVADGIGKVARSLFPLQFSETREVGRIENFDRDKLPWLAHVEKIEHREQRLSPQTLQLEETVEHHEVLVEPLGYLAHVLLKMFETLEIALWGTIVAVLCSIPLAYYGARNYTPNRLTYNLARGTVSLFRAIPELVSALFLVLMYGFGPIAGVLALGLHAAGFLGKFYAEDIENADVKPQEALRAIGANKVKTLWLSVLPQVIPQYIAYTLYILDRNVRMAVVIGLVGAGGIGQELKGRYDIFNYQHVGTILVVIFITVFLLDQLAARLRRHYI
jgi:phosphonate transport system permease protein